MKKKKKITFVTAVWKRPEIFDLFAKGINHLIENNPDVEIKVCVTGSEGNRSKKMVEQAGFLYREAKNEPLGRKMNQASLLAKSTNADYYILVGSDDVISDSLFKRYIDFMDYGYDYIYVTDCYFYNIETGKALYWGGYTKKHNRGHALGAGRVLSKHVMKKIGFKCWYDNKLNHVLDTAFDKIVEPHIKSRKALNCRQEKVFILDIKSDVNMTPFQVWENSAIIHNGLIKNEFGYLFGGELQNRSIERIRKEIDSIYNTEEVVDPRFHFSNKIHHTAIIHDNVEMGKNNVIGPYTVIGSNGEIRNQKTFEGNVIIGDDNVISELVTIQRPAKKGASTKVGSKNIIMAHSHLGHDAEVGSSCELCTGTILGGYAVIGDKVKLKLGVTVRNRVQIGTGSTIGMGSVVVKDVAKGSTQVGNPAKDLKVKMEKTG